MATSKWSHTTAKKMPQSNAPDAVIGVGTTDSNSFGSIINGDLTVNSSWSHNPVITATDTVIEVNDLVVTHEDFQDLLTLVRMLRSLPEEHDLKREFRMQQAVDRLRGKNEDSSNS